MSTGKGGFQTIKNEQETNNFTWVCTGLPYGYM